MRPLLFCLLCLTAAPAGAADAFTVSDGDRVVLIGNTLIEREQRHGHWETLLTLGQPGKAVVFRNLGWSGDTVFGDARAGFDTATEGFKRLRDHVLALKPTVILVGYGSNEAFEGEAGLARFEAGLNKLLDALAPAKARVWLLSPIGQEDLGPPLPAARAQNRNLDQYATAIHRTAQKRGHGFVDLLTPSRRLGQDRPLTDNGIHPTDDGYRRLAAVLAEGLGQVPARWLVELDATGKALRQDGCKVQGARATKDGLQWQARDETLPSGERLLRVRDLAAGTYVLRVDGNEAARATAREWAAGVRLSAGPDVEQADKLRATIREKNRLYFHRWRPQNETYLFGFRKHEQGQNAREIPQFDPLIAEQEKEIAKLSAPVTRRYSLQNLTQSRKDAKEEEREQSEGLELISCSSSFAPLRLCVKSFVAQRDAKVPDPDPELERKTFRLPEGFEANLFAADPLLAKPIQVHFDPAGRLWVACSEAYPQIKPGAKQNDKIIVLEDKDGDGRADKTTVFAEGLLIPTGLAPGDGGVYVVDSTDLVHLSDTDGDGKADRRRVILSGFGTEDTHHMVHSLRWGPDGLLYFNQSIYIHSHIETPHGPRRLNAGGIWQFDPRTLKLEVFARGWINAWGHHFDRWGQSFVTDGAGGEGVNYVVPGAAYPTAHGFSRILNGLNPGSPKYCGCEIASGRHLPEAWQGNVLTNDFRGHRVCRFVLKEDGSGFAAFEQAEVIKSSHPAFRPVDIRMGPDGAIYVADWYNPIIQHGEVDFRDPRRDQTHGRIWRVTAKGRPLVERPKLVGAKTEDLLEALKAPEDWTRHNARLVLRERGHKAVRPVLDAWAKKIDPKAEDLLLEALWTYQALNAVEPRLLATLLEAKEPRVRTAAVRVAGAWIGQLEDPLTLLRPRVHDAFPRVRMEAVRALAGVKSPAAAALALEATDHPLDRFLDYALWLTVRELQPVWLAPLSEGKIDFGGNVRRLTFALQAAGSPAAVRPLVELLRTGKVPADREENVLSLIAALGTPQDLGMVLELVLKETTPAGRKAVLLDGLAQAARQRQARPAGDLARVGGLLASTDEGVQASAARLAGAWKLEAVRPGLTELAGAKQTPAAVRRAALVALVGLGGRASKESIDRLAAGGPAEVRRLAVVALAGLDAAAAAARAAEVLAAGPADADPAEVVGALLAQKQGVALLAKALAGKKVPGDVARVALRTARASGRDVGPLEEALTRAGGLTAGPRVLTEAELKALVAEVGRRGDPARGEVVYRRKDQACMKCHAVGGAGGLVGPDLGSIGGSAQVDYLVEALLVPKKAIKEGYHALVVSTKQGQVITGVKVRQGDKELVLRTAEDTEVAVPLADIDEQGPGGSLMPEGLIDLLTRQELVDLVRFLSELGKGEAYQVGKERLVRRWQALEPTAEAYRGLTRDRLAAAATGASWQTWSPVYSTVSGELPLADLPAFTMKRALENTTQRVALVRLQVEVTTAGPVKLLFNDASGLQVWLGSQEREAGKELVLDLGTGTHTLTAAVDLDRRKAPLRVELADVPGSPARARLVGGK